MELLRTTGMCVLGATALIAILLALRWSRLWPLARAAVVTAALTLCLAVPLAWHTPSSFDALADGFELLPLAGLVILAGLLHTGLFLWLIGAAVREVARG